MRSKVVLAISFIGAIVYLGESLEKLWGTKCLFSCPEEGLFIPKSLSNISCNYTIGTIKYITKSTLILVHLNNHDYETLQTYLKKISFEMDQLVF